MLDGILARSNLQKGVKTSFYSKFQQQALMRPLDVKSRSHPGRKGIITLGGAERASKLVNDNGS